MSREAQAAREKPEQLSYDDIAGVLDVPVNTVRSRLFRARDALRQRLAQAAPARARGTSGR